jgi:hypothetical protein
MKRLATTICLAAVFTALCLTALGSDVASNAVPAVSGGLTAAASFPLTNKNALVAREGSYFLARNPTAGTGIAGHAAATTLDDTKALLVIKNNAAANSGINIYLDYIRLKLTSAGTAGTNMRFDMKLDNITRYSSAGTTLIPTNVNMGSTTASVAYGNTIFGAAVCAAAGGNARLLDGFAFRDVIGVVGDTYTMNFGGEAHPPIALITSGTAITHGTVNFHPVIIGPQQTFLLHQWSGSQSGAYAFEVSVGYWER